jgi:acetyl esterase/lipase
MNRYTRLVTFAFLLFLISSCSLTRITRTKNITYMEEGFLNGLPQKQLNVFAPRKASGDEPVFVFFYGGSWNSGKKEIYNFFGNRLARKGVVTVIVDYPLSPDYQVHDMAKSSAQAVKWTKENIKDYGGNRDKIFVSGHSAGGHLASLITIREEYFDTLGMNSPIKGAILIDAAGLDMNWFLKEMDYKPGTSYLKAFTDSPQVWKDTSPIYHLDSEDPPLLIMMGERTLPGIEKTTARFMEEYKKLVPEPKYHLQERKKHVPMIAQFFYTPNKAYQWILDFMEVN